MKHVMTKQQQSLLESGQLKYVFLSKSKIKVTELTLCYPLEHNMFAQSHSKVNVVHCSSIKCVYYPQTSQLVMVADGNGTLSDSEVLEVLIGAGMSTVNDFLRCIYGPLRIYNHPVIGELTLIHLINKRFSLDM